MELGYQSKRHVTALTPCIRPGKRDRKRERQTEKVGGRDRNKHGQWDTKTDIEKGVIIHDKSRKRKNIGGGGGGSTIYTEAYTYTLFMGQEEEVLVKSLLEGWKVFRAAGAAEFGLFQRSHSRSTQSSSSCLCLRTAPSKQCFLPY